MTHEVSMYGSKHGGPPDSIYSSPYPDISGVPATRSSLSAESASLRETAVSGERAARSSKEVDMLEELLQEFDHAHPGVSSRMHALSTHTSCAQARTHTPRAPSLASMVLFGCCQERMDILTV